MSPPPLVRPRILPQQSSLPMKQLSVIFGKHRMKNAEFTITQYDKAAEYSCGRLSWDTTAQEVALPELGHCLSAFKEGMLHVSQKRCGVTKAVRVNCEA